jgi:rhamnosyltransferase
MPKVSIIVRSYNDKDFIAQTMRSIREQHFQDFEIINVDSASTDGTYEIVQKMNPDGIVYQIPPGTYIPGKALNEAIDKASGEIIVFNNSDCIPQNKFWLENLIKPLLENSDIIATFGNQLPRPDAFPVVRKDSERAFGDGTISAKWFHFFSLATSAIRAEIIRKYPFDPDIQYSEDIDWSYRMKKMGFRIEYVSDAIVEHSHNYTLSQLKKRFYGEGVAEGKIYKQHKHFFINFVKPFMIELLRDAVYLNKHKELRHFKYAIIYRFWQKYSVYQGNRDYFRKARLGLK